MTTFCGQAPQKACMGAQMPSLHFLKWSSSTATPILTAANPRTKPCFIIDEAPIFRSLGALPFQSLHACQSHWTPTVATWLPESRAPYVETCPWALRHVASLHPRVAFLRRYPDRIASWKGSAAGPCENKREGKQLKTLKNIQIYTNTLVCTSI